MNERYYLESIVAEIANNVDDLIRKKVISDEKKIYCCGLDRFSFALRTILAKRNYKISGYLVDNQITVDKIIREQKDFASRYLNSVAEMIPPILIKDFSKKRSPDSLVLCSSKNSQKLLEQYFWKKENDYFMVRNEGETCFERIVKGKKRLELVEIKKIEKDILKYVDEFCNAHGLRYWVCGGTLLGTIRHKGFIPWDDDIDVFMPWSDFIEFAKIFDGGKKYDLLMRNNENPGDHLFPMIKIIDKRTALREDLGTYRIHNGVWIDVFAISGLPTNEQDRKNFFYTFHEMEKKMWECFYENDGEITQFPQWYDKELEMIKKYDFDNMEYVGVLGTKYQERDAVNIKVYKETIRMPFEDIEVNVPVGYKEYLNNLYGNNWEEIPEEGKRNTDHNIEAYWME